MPLMPWPSKPKNLIWGIRLAGFDRLLRCERPLSRSSAGLADASGSYGPVPGQMVCEGS